MLKIVGTEIHLTKGDSAYLNIEITNGQGVLYIPQTGDKVIMTVRNTLDNELAFQKTVDAGTCIVIQPMDTLGVPVGRYKYDVELNTVSGDVFTVIPKSTFYLEEEVTHE